jgi:hypothetical protein
MIRSNLADVKRTAARFHSAELYAAQKSIGLTHGQCAALASVPRDTWIKWVTGRRSIPIEQRERFAQLWNLDRGRMGLDPARCCPCCGREYESAPASFKESARADRETLAAMARVHLVAGPYAPLSYPLGAQIRDLIRGEYCTAEGFSKIGRWPYCAAPGGTRHLIVDVELSRLITMESVCAVMALTGASRSWVTRARRALGIGRWNLGTLELWRRMGPVRLNLESARKGAAATNQIRRQRTRA